MSGAATWGNILALDNNGCEWTFIWQYHKHASTAYMIEMVAAYDTSKAKMQCIDGV